MLHNLVIRQKVIPAVKGPAALDRVLGLEKLSVFFLLLSDINSIGSLIERSKRAGKKMIVHFDLVEGLGKDEAGLKFLHRLGCEGVITTRTAIARQAKKEGLIAIQRLFIIDSEALKSGLKQIAESRPHGIELLPATLPDWVIQEIQFAFRLPIIGGGLIRNRMDVREALNKGFAAISTSNEDLWEG